MDWQELATTSHYQTAVTVKEQLLKGDIEEATAGLEELIDALSRSDKRALRSQLIRLMVHIIKWKTQPENRSRSWAATIASARIEIAEMLESEPSLKPLVPAWLTDLFEKAAYIAQKEMGQQTALTELSWQAIFDEEYSL